jgi:hypothetical protein
VSGEPFIGLLVAIPAMPGTGANIDFVQPINGTNAFYQILVQ